MIRSSACYRLLAAALLAAVAGCDRLDMYDQPRYESLEASNFFADGLSARPMVPGTIARGHLHDNEALYTGKLNGALVSQIPEPAVRAVYARYPQQVGKPAEQAAPVELRRAMLARGQERYNIYCAVCHGQSGGGDGMVVQRGFRKPPSYHIDRLRSAPAGHFFDIASNGIGAMPSYGTRIPADDRWAIVAYVRALQLSQNARPDDVPADQQSTLNAAAQRAGGAKP